MAQLKRSQYHVLVEQAGEDVEHTVTVIHGDQIRGEQQARARKLPPLNDAPIEHASLWVWCAMTRLQLTTLAYSEWVDTVIELETVKDAAGNPELVTADPTPALSTD